MGDRVDVQNSRLNAEAPEFVPSRRSLNQRKPAEEFSVKLLNQVEYYFSDLNLATTDHLMGFIAKDPAGFVPISAVASFKKIKGVIGGHAQLSNTLRASSKLEVSEDGKRVRRVKAITESDIQELQCRIVVAENLPEDHCHQNLMKIFGGVGSVKNIRTCPPKLPKSDSKLHAFVEYESVELAEKAVRELANWRSGLRLRLMMTKSKQAEEEDGEGAKRLNVENEDKCVKERKEGGHGRKRDKRGRPTPSARGLQTTQPPGPRMPDGTRGFAMGRGKPLVL